VDGPEKWAELAGAHLFVLPSHNENFAIAALEALAVGTPVLLSDQVGLSDYVKTNNLGWVCAPEVEALRETLQQAAASKSRRAQIRLLAPEKIRNDFNAGKLAQAYLDQYPLQWPN